mmetsp:Transcript_23845/g.21185  ORF Transcript_23845/g.21185 Transcript_23845/m.21185 type:complete len:131 (-) Transcript_23845:28-420(-)
MNKNFIEEDDEVITGKEVSCKMNSGYNSKISFGSMNKLKNTEKKTIQDKAISILNKFVGNDNIKVIKRRVSHGIDSDQIAIKKENQKVLNLLIQKCNEEKEDLRKRQKKLKFKRYGLLKKFRLASQKFRF